MDIVIEKLILTIKELTDFKLTDFQVNDDCEYLDIKFMLDKKGE